MTLPASPLLTREEAAKYLRVCLRTFARLNIEGIRIGGRRIFFTPEILDAWLARKTPRSASSTKPVARTSTTTRPTVVAASSRSTSLTETARKYAEKLEKREKQSGAA